MALNTIYFITSVEDQPHYHIYVIPVVDRKYIEKVIFISNIKNGSNDRHLDAMKLLFELLKGDALKYDSFKDPYEYLEAIIPAERCDECGELFGIPDYGWYEHSSTKKMPPDGYKHLLQNVDAAYKETTWSTLETGNGKVLNVCEKCYCTKTNEQLKESAERNKLEELVSIVLAKHKDVKERARSKKDIKVIDANDILYGMCNINYRNTATVEDVLEGWINSNNREIDERMFKAFTKCDFTEFVKKAANEIRIERLAAI